MKPQSLGEGGRYRRGAAVLKILFTEKAPYGQHCPLCRYEEPLRRYSCRAEKDGHCFLTRPQGIPTAKSPMEMFPPKIDNDSEKGRCHHPHILGLAPLTDKK